MPEKQVVEVTKKWREVLKAYQSLKDVHEAFRMAAEGINLDFAGPGLQEALVRLFHRRRFNMFLEDLLFEDFRKGGVSQLVPPKESTEKKKEKSGKKSEKKGPSFA